MIAATAYFAGAHVFDALYVLTCKTFSYFAAIGTMFAVLAGVSAVLVFFHARIKERTGWDVLGLDRLNRLRDADTPQGQIGKLFIQWLMQRRLTLFLFGSCLVGPPVVAMLLRKPDSPADNAFYILSGTLISVVVWVTVWKGFWTILREYVSPLLGA